MTVTVTVSDTGIADIQIDHKETDSISTAVIEQFSKTIIDIRILA